MTEVQHDPAPRRPDHRPGLARFALRSLLVAGASTVVSVVLFGGFFGGAHLLAYSVQDVVLVVLFPVLVTALATGVRHRTRHTRWWSSGQRRWLYGGVMTVSGVVALVVLVVALVAVDDSVGALGDSLTVGMVVVAMLGLLTGLPVWLLVVSVLVGPGEVSASGEPA